MKKMNHSILLGLLLSIGLTSCSSTQEAPKSPKEPEQKVIAEDDTSKKNGQLIRERFVTEQGKLGACYAELKIPSGSKEEVLAQVEFSISPETGMVNDVQVLRTTHIALSQCLETALKQMNFTGVIGKDLVKVKQTFNFTAE